MFIWALHRCLPVRHFALALLSLLLVSFMLIPGTTPVAAMALNGSQQSGTNANGEGYRLFTLANLTDVSAITVSMAAGTGYIAVFAADQGTAIPLPTVETTPWHLLNTRQYVENGTDVPVATFDLAPVARTSSILVLSRTDDGQGAPAPVGITANGAVVAPSVQPRRHDGSPTATVQVRPTTPMATVTTKVPTSTAVATTVPATATRPPTVAPTATPGATVIPSTATSPPATMIPSTATAVAVNNGTPAAQCHDLGDGAVDQHGVSVDVWAAGVRQACGFLGYENGDNPMPSGTPFDAPRPFRFDYTYDHNEAASGFKVFYWNGDADHCGDMRAVVHQGGDVHGIQTRFHTFQFAIALCDDARNKHIIDVGGQADTGSLILESRPSDPIGETGNGASRFTADIDSCSGRPTPREGCYTRWYPSILFEVPGGGPNGSTGLGGATVEFQVDRPITLADPNNLQRVVLANNLGVSGWDGVSRTVSEWMVFNLNSGNQSTWWTTWDANQHKQVIVPAGTPGAWQMRMDGGISSRNDGVNVANCEAGFGCDKRTHANPISGIIYPN